MSERETQNGYAAYAFGKPFDEFQSVDWQDGWKTADDYKYWRGIADALGGEVYAFSHRHAGSIRIGASIHDVAGEMLAAIERLIASGTEARSAATTGSARKGDGPTAEGGDAQTNSPSSTKGQEAGNSLLTDE